MPRLTAGRMRLAKHCTHFTVLPAAQGPQSAEASAGRVFASAMETGAVDATALAALPDTQQDDVARWWGLWCASPWKALPWSHEQAWVWDAASDSARASPHGRSTKTEPGEVLGITDLHMVLDGCLYVADAKSGAQMNAEPVAYHSQLRFNAMAASRALMVDRAKILIFHFDQRLEPTEHRLGADDLDDIADETRALLAQPTEANPGKWCRSLWCPSFGACEAVTVAAESAVTQGLVTLGGKAPAKSYALTMDPKALATADADRILWQHTAVGLAEKFVEQAKKATRAEIDRRGGIPTRPGYRLRATDDAEVIATGRQGWGEASALLHELGLDAAIETRTVTECSKASIERALQAKDATLGGKKLDAEVERVMGEMRRLDCTAARPSGKYAERKEAKRPEGAGSTT